MVKTFNLSEEEVKMYFNQLQKGDEKAKEKIIEHYFYLIENEARKLSFNSFLRDDLIGEGHFGLLEAIKGFDLTKEVPFSFFASLCIKRKMFAYLKKTDKQKSEISLEAPLKYLDNETINLLNYLEDKKVNIEKEIVNQDINEELYKRLDYLSPLYKQVITLLYGLKGNKRHTYQETALKCGLTKKQIDNMRIVILRTLRKSFEDYSIKEIEATNNLYKYFSNLNFKQFIFLYKEQFNNLNQIDQDEIKRFYNVYNQDLLKLFSSLEKIEKQINKEAFPFLTAPSKLGKDKLIPIYETNKDSFTEYHQNIIEYYLYKNKDIEVISKEFNKSNRIIKSTWNSLKTSLELKYFNIDKKNLDQETVTSILNNPNYIISDWHQKIVALYYGIGYKRRYQIKEIASKLKEPYLKTHDSLMYMEEKMRELLYGVSYSGEKKDNSNLISYITNNNYSFSKQTREILKLYLIEGLSYEEISKIYQITKPQVSNIVTDGIRKANFYRFGIVKKLIVLENDLEDFFQVSNFSYKEKEIIKERYLSLKEIKELLKENKISRFAMEKLFFQFEKNFIKHKYKINLKKEDYQKEIAYHQTDTVLTKEELKLISLFWGIASKYNSTGRIFSLKEIRETLNLSSRVCNNSFNRAELKLLKKKAGLLDSLYGIMNKEALEEVFKDKRVPLNNKEIEILKHLKEIDNYSFLSSKDLAKKYQMSESSILRVYQRAILKIKQYELGEIEGKYNYEEDILPNKRFFPKDYRLVLEAKYKNDLSAFKISQLTGESIDQVRYKLKRIKFHLAGILKKDENITKFDYDLMEKLVLKKDLVLYGKRRLKLKAFKMFYGLNGYQRHSLVEIVQNLNLKIEPKTLSSHIKEVELAIEKYKIGIRNPKWFTYSQLLDYYHHNQDYLNFGEKEKILTFLEKQKRYLDDKDINARYTNKTLPFNLKYNLACFLYGKTIDFNTMSLLELEKAFQNKKISYSNKLLLENYLGNSYKDIINNNTKRKLLKIMSKIYEEKNKDQIKENQTKVKSFRKKEN
ncbi:MAG: sigma-70 family RNA polymerase sigma factor [Bacilli bacterium]|jgi:RNA polymerase sporulation-specific sigma factor